MSSSADVRRRRGAKYWSLVVAGGVAVLIVTAGVVLGVNLLLGRSLQDATSSLPTAVIGLGPYIGMLIQAERRRKSRG